MKYEVNHTVLRSPTHRFKQGDVLTEKELADAGFDVPFLVKNGSVEPLKGTELDGEPLAENVPADGKPGKGKAANPFAARAAAHTHAAPNAVHAAGHVPAAAPTTHHAAGKDSAGKS